MMVILRSRRFIMFPRKNKGIISKAASKEMMFKDPILKEPLKLTIKIEAEAEDEDEDKEEVCTQRNNILLDTILNQSTIIILKGSNRITNKKIIMMKRKMKILNTFLITPTKKVPTSTTTKEVNTKINLSSSTKESSLMLILKQVDLNTKLATEEDPEEEAEAEGSTINNKKVTKNTKEHLEVEDPTEALEKTTEKNINI